VSSSLSSSGGDTLLMRFTSVLAPTYVASSASLADSCCCNVAIW